MILKKITLYLKSMIIMNLKKKIQLNQKILTVQIKITKKLFLKIIIILIQMKTI